MQEVHRTILSKRATRPHSENESSPFFGMYQKQHHQQQACTLLYTRTCVESFFLGGGWDLALYCTYVPRVRRVFPCPILLVRTSYHTVFSCVYHVSREHSTAAVNFHFGEPRTLLS